MNDLSVCLDEIALEGLDGITISTLWRRIQSATLCSTVDESYKNFLWRCISSCQDIEAYLLEKPREEIANFASDSEIYPYHCIVNEAGIRGSCATFQTRSLVDVSNISLDNAVERYGNTLVFVASQLLRNKVLLGPEFDFSVKIPETSYCLLEIIGRARKLGRLHSNLGLQTMVDSRSLFAQVKILVELQLITKQSVVTRNRNIPSSMIYLARYHTEHSYDSMQFKISEALGEAPDCCMPLESLCSLLGKEKELIEPVLKDLSKSGHVECAYVNNGLFPDSSDITSAVNSEISETQKGDKVIRLFHHFHNLSVEGDNEIEDEEWIQPEKQDLSLSIPAEVPIMHAIYKFIASKGADGASLTECCQELSFPFFAMRKILKDMECLQVLICNFKDMGKTKQNVYSARHTGRLPQDGNSIFSQAIGSSALHGSQPTEIIPSTIMDTNKTTHLPSTPQIPTHPPIILMNQPLTSKTPDVQPSEVQMMEIAPSHSPCPLAKTTQNSVSSTPLIKLQASQATHSPTSCTTIPNQSKNTSVNNKTAQKESVSSTPQLQPSSVNDTKKPVKSRSQKIIETEKFMRRKAYILNLLKHFKVIEGQFLFQRAIRMEEKKIGLTITIDRKSVSFLLRRLAQDGLLKRVEQNVKVGDVEHKVELFCDVSIQDNTEEMQSCIQNVKDRITIREAKRNGDLPENKKSVISGLLPKMPRAEMLHMFLFYVIYELNNPDVDLEAMRRKFAWAEHLKPEHGLKNMDKGWFTPFSVLFLLPVSLYFKLVDISFHNSVLQEYFDNPATKNMLLKDLPPLARQILFDRRRSHFLFESFELLAYFGLITPTNKQIFFHERDIACYLHSSTVVVDTRESEASYDEVKHPEGGNFPEKSFTFAGMADLEHYWSTVRNVCMTTPLNRRRAHDNKSRLTINFESLVVDEKELQTVGKPRGDGLGAAGFDSRLYVHLLKKWQWSLAEKRAAGKDSDVEDTLDWQICFANNQFLSENIDVGLTPKKKKKTKRKREKPAENENAKKKKKVVNEEKTEKKKVANEEKTEKKKVVNEEKTEKKKVVNEEKTEASLHDSNSLTAAQQNASTAQQSTENVHKGKKKRKKRKKKKVEPGINKTTSKSHGHWSKRIHDKRDEEALKRLQEKRNTFTPQQQKLLFICCLALRIIGKKSVDTGYNDWLWTRDILYKDNYESAKTKTALSICRKYRTMVKNAQTKTNLDICVADCMQEKEFQPYCNIGKNCNEAMFNELVELLKNKYSMESMVGNRLALPSTMKEFELQKNLYNSLDVENSERCDEDILSLESRETSVADIRQRIIRDSIVSALLLSNVSYPSHVAFRFLSQFTEEELIIAISVLKNGRIVVRKQLRYARTGLDLASCTFSQMLSNHGQRIIDNHFPSLLLNDAESFYNEVANAGKSLENVNSLERFVPLKFSDSPIDGGKVYCVFSLLTCQRLAVNMEVPDVFLTLAKIHSSKKPKTVPENANEELSTKNYGKAIKECSSLTISNSSSHSQLSKSSINVEELQKEKFKDSISVVSGTSEDRSLCRNSDTSQTSSVQEKPCTSKTIDQGESRPTTKTIDQEKDRSTSQISQVQDEDEFQDEEGATIPGNINRKRSNDMVLDVLCGIEDHLFGSLDIYANTSLYKVNLKPTSTFTCSMTTSDIDSVRSSGHKHAVLRDVEKSSLRDKNIYESYLEKIATYQRTGDLNRIHFSINPCNIHVRLLPVSDAASSSQEESLAQSVAHHFKSNGLKMPETIEECVKVCSKMFGYSIKDCEAVKAVYDTINNSKEIGMSSAGVEAIIKRQHSNFSIDGLIKVLEAFNLVYQVGFVEVCYVSKAFKKHWFLNVWEGDVGSSSEVSNSKKEQTSNGKRKRSVCQEETYETEEGQPNVATTLDNPTSSNTQERTASCGTRSKTCDEQSSKDKRHSCSDDNSTQTERYSCKPCRPWITMAGEINKSAYNTLHRSVLAYIMKYPGVQKYAITKHFVNLVYPVALDDILKKLEDCGCIERRFCYIKEETLFSSKNGKKSTYYLSKSDAIFKLLERVFLR